MTRYSDDAIPMKKRNRPSFAFKPNTNENSMVSKESLTATKLSEDYQIDANSMDSNDLAVDV